MDRVSHGIRGRFHNQLGDNLVGFMAFQVGKQANSRNVTEWMYGFMSRFLKPSVACIKCQFRQYGQGENGGEGRQAEFGYAGPQNDGDAGEVDIEGEFAGEYTSSRLAGAPSDAALSALSAPSAPAARQSKCGGSLRSSIETHRSED
jgi:hypothetical protein